MNKRIAVLGVAMCLTACGSIESVDGGRTDSDAIVIGSQTYYSNEVIAEIYAQALEKAGYKVDRQFQIGQREVYMSEVENGSIDVFPEYSGPLLQYWKPDTTVRLPEAVYAELQSALPSSLQVLNQAEASDQDSYVVTKQYSEEHGIKSIQDLAKVKNITLGANSEAEDRPNGPKGLKSVYGVDAAFTPIEDSGGPLTVKALKDGDIQLAIIYSADPSIAANNLVSLEDPKGQFLASRVVPLANKKLDADAAAVLNKVNAQLTTQDLIQLNTRSVTEQLPSALIAKEWLKAH
ncbi:Glycine betaine-binding protein [Corynebacterium pseudotuberculosis]|uniref:ABC transporter substrate-binding protein n=1 Tax=Corynebacterium pseudotuberculosis TaxID=1719 RepID=UPI0001DD455B|nr:ABC transporter substrate-binding protein [Corynebacterium pseudotuberculosis]ADL20005.1 ABC transporter substrate-binding protein [Corynebacterium pseudotuberculosis 1002]AJC12841.1 Glycine betaine-binding protein [Corynebacterium pseudotuberculosis]AKJ54770.1 Glycine betaine-binding protein [Corynebacterium pseudotuberculosis]ALM76719.1 Glycine betaine-binding protein [Corynebacterium pseudotuberculosis]ANK55512.1 glycine betaine-binding protein [Corynebacterium pseudotuberculosis]